MAANKILKIPPVYVPSAAGNLLNGALSSLAGPVGFTITQPYILVKHIRLSNKDSAAHTVTLYQGATGGSAGGTEFGFDAVSIPAKSNVDYYCQARFESPDFLTGVADTANVVTINIDAEIGFS